MQSEEKGIAPAEEKYIADAIADIDKELNELEKNSHIQSNEPIQIKRNSKIDLSEMIGVADNKKTENEEPIFLSPKQIKAEKLDYSRIVPSGLTNLDKRIMGFCKGELCVWSGSNGSGKSSVISQLAINGIDKGFKVSIFSAELSGARLLNWTQLQCAGKKYTKTTKYENFYTVPDDIKDKINNWLEGNLYIYNNDYGSKVERVLKAINDCIDKYKVDVVVIDNLMALDLSSAAGEKYDRQSNLVLALSQLAKKRDVVIHFICHPRKSMGFLRKQDISGSSDLTNLADKVFIVHRCNNDFKRSIKEFLGIKDDSPLLRYDNIIEVCKDRMLGISDEFIGTIFEKESKRFLNIEDESKYYGWEKDSNGFVKCDDNIKLPFED